MMLVVAGALVTSLVMGPAPSSSVATRAAAPMMKGRISDKFVWVSFLETSKLTPGGVESGFQYGQEIAIACTQKGAIFALSNKLPPTGQPATLGSVVDDVITEPLTGTAFSLKTGKVKGDWCPSLLGKLIFGRLIQPQDVPVFQCRKQGSKVQVLININAKAQFEQGYWRGVLDSQGKVDGGYY